MNKDNNPKTRRFNFLLYPEDKTHNMLLMRIMSGEFEKYAYILHDKDTYLVDVGEHKAGELKKAHYHAIIEFPNSRYLNAVADDLGIERNYLQPTGSFKKSLTYLIHYEDEIKYHYDIEEVQGPLKSKLIKFLDDTKLTYDEQCYIIFNYIYNANHYITWSELSQFCLDNNVFNACTRARGIIENVLFEQNGKYRKG